MPIPTPPKKDLLKVTPPRPAIKKVVKKGPSKSTQKLTKDIRDLTEAQKDDKNTVEQPKKMDSMPEELLKPKTNSLKRLAFKPPEHMTQNPFRENDALRKLSYDLKKETEPKKPVKRSPKRTPANKTTGAK